MRRGDLVTAAMPGQYGKPRPALIVQADAFDRHPSVTVLPITSDLRQTPLFRVTVQPSSDNGLRKPSQVMIDKAHTVPRERVGPPIGCMDAASMRLVDRSLAAFLGLG